MKVTDELLQVARAVRTECVRKCTEIGERSDMGRIDLAALIAALPEAAPLPAPTGPGWWWARDTKDRWGWRMVEIRESKEVPGHLWLQGTFSRIEHYDAWVGPLAEPAA